MASHLARRIRYDIVSGKRGLLLMGGSAVLSSGRAHQPCPDAITPTGAHLLLMRMPI